MSQNPNFFLSVGKNIKNEYGRIIGRVASFALTPNGRFDAVFIEQGNGKFAKRSIEHLNFNGKDVILLSSMKSEAKALSDQIPLIWRKDQALKELVDKKRISPELYEELHNNFNGALNQLKSETQTIMNELDTELMRCTNSIKELHYALVNLEIEHEIGKINDSSYQIAFTMIQENFKFANMEKKDLELTKNNLSNILLGDTSKTLEKVKTPEQKETPAKAETKKELEPEKKLKTPDLPEPPVVVYVKE
jgi:hypothetical protein